MCDCSRRVGEEWWRGCARRGSERGGLLYCPTVSVSRSFFHYASPYDQELISSYPILPTTARPARSDEPASRPGLGTLVTVFWLERCLFDKRLYPHEHHFASRPANVTFPIPGAEGVVLTVSGFEPDGVDRIQLDAVMAEIGAPSNPALRRYETTHLLCPLLGAVGPKAEKAREWGIPIVDLAFVRTILEKGRIEPSPSVQVRPSRPNRVGSGNTTDSRVETRTGSGAGAVSRCGSDSVGGTESVYASVGPESMGLSQVPGPGPGATMMAEMDMMNDRRCE